MNLEKPSNTTIEIEKERAELERIISHHGLQSRIVLEKSKKLDEMICNQMKISRLQIRKDATI